MGPFASKNVINEIQIRQGKWISVLGQISENELTKETAIPQTSETETSKEETESTETVVEGDSTAERPKVSAISKITLFLIAVLGVLLVMILVLHIRGRASQ
jgi:hypothetical protein